MTEANDAHRYAKDGFVHEGGAFVAQAQATKALEPSEVALDHPATGAQAAAMGLTALGQDSGSVAV